MSGLFYEEFKVDHVFKHPLTRTVTEYDNMSFSLMTMNPQQLHIDSHFSAQTEWGKPLVNSLFTLGLLIGMTVQDTTLGTTIGNLGMSDVKFPNPVFQGDTLRAETKVIGKRESRSRPDTGIVELDRKSTRLNSSHVAISYAVFCLKKKNT